MTLWRFDAIGVPWEIETESALPEAVRGSVGAVIEEFDRAWSRFRDDSAVSALAAGAASVPAPADAAEMIELYAELSAATRGAVSPLIGDALARRGYDSELSFVDRGAAPAPAHWQDLLRADAHTLSLREPAVIDVGALGKGRLVDRVLAALDGVAGSIVVDASGDLAVRGGPVSVGLEHPFDATRAIGAWTVTEAALCASATNRRAWGDGLHHVLDARTGEPVRVYAATWALAPTAMAADAAATALFFDGGAAWAHARGIEWVRMTTDGRVEWSPRCTAELFL